MADVAETLLKFRLAQLEGKLAIYEALINEVSRLEHIERIASSVRSQLEDVVVVWNACGLGEKYAN